MDILKDLPGSETVDKITDSGVFVLTKLEEKIFITEFCDEYYSFELNKEYCKDLSDYFLELSKRI